MSTAESGEGTDAVWVAALDALEADIVETERVLQLLAAQNDLVPEGRPVWTAPSTPLPPALAPRTAALLARQQSAADSVSAAMASNRRQQRRSSQLAAQLDQRPARSAVYVDAAV